MKRSILYITVLGLFMTFSCKSDKKEDSSENSETETMETETYTEESTSTSEEKKITFALESKSNSEVTGNVVFTQDGDAVTMVALLSGLTEGEHAIHIHEKADCSSSDGKSSGGHWNPTGQPHGKWGADSGYHKGDIGNFSANDKGQATITKITDEWCIGCGDDSRDILGKAIIVHQGIDDFTSQPSGAAGSRVSCGGIIQ
ncbi:MAG: superoxide dismutase family protein [Psychroserpens sp.]|uniref:superoxide dismutase family protein n=1 Tax=Psychroserpens sp. TaxID=2020870 RepID=UPI003CA2025C